MLRATALALLSSFFMNTARAQEAIVFAIDDDISGWRGRPADGGTAKVTSVDDETAGHRWLRLSSHGGRRTRFPAGVRLPSRLRSLTYRGLRFRYRGQGEPQRVGVMFQADDVEGHPSNFAARLFINDDRWHTEDLTQFWSKTKRQPDLSTIRVLTIAVTADVDLDLKQIALIAAGSIISLEASPVLFARSAPSPGAELNTAGTPLTLKDGAQPDFPTVVTASCDANALRLDAQLTFPEGTVPRTTISRPGGSVWKDDVIEFCLDPQHTHRKALYFAVNMAGVTSDTLAREGLGGGPPWQASVREEGSVRHITVSIPFATLGAAKPATGTVWGLNIKRILYGVDDTIREHTGWAAVQSQDAADYGDLVFSQTDGIERPTSNIERPTANAGKSSDPDIGPAPWLPRPRSSIRRSTLDVGRSMLDRDPQNTFGDELRAAAPVPILPLELFVPKPGVYRFLVPSRDLGKGASLALALSLPGRSEAIAVETPVEDTECTVIEAVAPPEASGIAHASIVCFDADRSRVVAYANGTFPVSLPPRSRGHDEILLWPPPKQLRWGDGSCRLGTAATVHVQPDSPPRPAKHLCQRLEELFGLRLTRTQAPGPAGIVIGLDVAGLGGKPESYRLIVAPDRIEVHGSDEHGIYYGVRSLLSLIDQSTPRGGGPQARCVEIQDWPDQPFRALWVQMDWGYSARMSVVSMQEFLYRTVAGNRYNAVIFNSGGGVKYARHPELGGRGAIPISALAQMAEYGRQHCVDVIPGCNCFGHGGWLLHHHPELREDGDRHTLCTRHPEALALLFDIYDELCEAMPSRYFHIGFDEVRWKTDETDPAERCPRCAGQPKAEIFLEHTLRVHEFFRKKGRRMIMWNDMLVPAWNGGRPNHVATVRDQLPKDIIMMPWGRVGEPIKPFAELGLTVYRSHTGFNQGRLDDFHKDYDCISGDGMAITSKTPWLTFIHFEDRVHSQYHFLANAIAGACAWSRTVAEQELTRTISEWGSHIARLHGSAQRHGETGRFMAIDLAGAASRSLGAEGKSPWFTTDEGRDLSAFPTGDVDIAGIPFIFSGSACAPSEGEASTPVTIGKQIRAFVVMHTVHVPDEKTLAQVKTMVVSKMDSDRGLVVGTYELEYDDGTRQEFPLRLGYNVYLWDGDPASRYLYGSRWTWTGGTPEATQQDPFARDVGIQQTEYRNPHPERLVKTLKLRNAGTGAIPVLTGLSVEEVEDCAGES